MDQRTVSKNKVTFNVSGSDEAWRSFQDNTWEPATFKILDKVLRPEQTVADIGAWMGPISLYAASKVKKCYSFEPDPIAFKELLINIKLNPDLEKKIVPLNQAVTRTGAPVKLFSRYTYGDSGSSVLKRIKSANQYVEVSSTTFQDFIRLNQIENIQFIKMDIEGGEFFVLPQMREYLERKKPILLVSFHFDALCEYIELKYLPFGIIRRIYRALDPYKIIIKYFATKLMDQVITSLDFYHVYNNDLEPITTFRNKKVFYQKIDMLLFTQDRI